MELALRVEERNIVMALKKSGVNWYKSSSSSYTSKGSIPIATSTTGSLPASVSVKNWASGLSDTQSSATAPEYTGSSMFKTGGEVRRLSEKELQDKRAKGLCFKCDDKWVAGHRCKHRELNVLLMDDANEDGSENAGSEPPPSPTEEEPVDGKGHPEVSLNSVVGLSNPKTMKLKRLLGNHEVIVLIDPGATHNFVSLAKAMALPLPITDEGGFGVSLGNGETVKGKGVCKDVMLQLDGGVVVQDDFLPLELGATDIILGIQWVEQLGPVTTNWKTQVMQFQVGTNLVTLLGDPSLVRSKVSLKSMLRTLKKDKQGYLVEIHQL